MNKDTSQAEQPHSDVVTLVATVVSEGTLPSHSFLTLFPRWLGTTRQCPLCRRTVSEVSSDGPSSDFNGFQIPSNGPSSTAARLTFGDSPARFRSRLSRPEVNSFISPNSQRRLSHYTSRRGARERSIDSYNSWTSGDMSD